MYNSPKITPKELRSVHEHAFKKKVNILIQLTRPTTEKWFIMSRLFLLKGDIKMQLEILGESKDK